MDDVAEVRMACHRLRSPVVGSVYVVVCLFTLLTAQSSKPAFEVASVKRNVSGRASNQNVQPGGRFLATNTLLADVIQFAYGIRDVQLVGGPEWVRKERFDLTAKAEREVPASQIRVMLQSLLEDRFRLVLRKEQREMLIHEVGLNRADGRLGPTLIQLSSEAECADARAKLPRAQRPAGFIALQACGPISNLADIVSGYVNTVVVDRTGLAGTWLIFAYFAPDRASQPNVGQLADLSLPSYFTAFQEQLGLKIRATRGLVEVLIIESVQQPTEN